MLAWHATEHVSQTASILADRVGTNLMRPPRTKRPPSASCEPPTRLRRVGGWAGLGVVDCLRVKRGRCSSNNFPKKKPRTNQTKVGTSKLGTWAGHQRHVPVTRPGDDTCSFPLGDQDPCTVYRPAECRRLAAGRVYEYDVQRAKQSTSYQKKEKTQKSPNPISTHRCRADSIYLGAPPASIHPPARPPRPDAAGQRDR